MTNLPSRLAHSVATWEDETAAEWLRDLPGRLARLSAVWEVELDPPFEPGGVTAYVAPARRADGSGAVVKVVIPHREATHEAAALDAWAGDGAVRLLAHASQDHAMLLERCEPGSALGAVGDEEQILTEAATVLSRLWRPPADDHPFEQLAAVAEWFADLVVERQTRLARPLPSVLVDRAVDLLRILPSTADRHVILHHDFHPANVLASERGWLAIDPKPQVGDPAFDPVQLVLQTTDPLDEDDPPTVVRRRVEVLADLLDVDAARMAAWGLARCVEWALYEIDTGRPGDGARAAARAELFAPLAS